MLLRTAIALTLLVAPSTVTDSSAQPDTWPTRVLITNDDGIDAPGCWHWRGHSRLRRTSSWSHLPETAPGVQATHPFCRGRSRLRVDRLKEPAWPMRFMATRPTVC